MDGSSVEAQASPPPPPPNERLGHTINLIAPRHQQPVTDSWSSPWFPAELQTMKQWGGG